MSLRELSVTLHLEHPIPVGTLVEQNGGRMYWEYAAGFLASNASLSPYALPKRPGLHRHDAKAGVPIPGVFSDSRPDGWGLRLLHRAFTASGRPRPTLSALDELAYLGDRAMGALTYAPSTGPETLFEAVELGALGAHARSIYAGAIDEVLPALLRAGGSPGGARPKALIGRRGDEMCIGEANLPEGFEPWLIKFERPEDDADCARREEVWLDLACKAGIEVPDHQTIDLGPAGTALATRRFDRAPRRHMLSAAGALDVDFRTAVVDYSQLGRLSAFLCAGDQRQVREWMRRAAFNVVMGNDDDHLKNHAWLYDGDRWALSPAYDLTWSPQQDRSSPVCGRTRDVSRTALIELGVGLGMREREATHVLHAVLEAASGVRVALEAAGCTTVTSLQATASVEGNITRLSRS